MLRLLGYLLFVGPLAYAAGAFLFVGALFVAGGGISISESGLALTVEKTDAIVRFSLLSAAFVFLATAYIVSRSADRSMRYFGVVAVVSTLALLYSCAAAALLFMSL